MERCSYMSCITVLLLLFCNLIYSTETTKQCPFKSHRGHMKPFGYHARQWLRVESRYDEVSAEEFYSKYVRQSKPVVIRGGIIDWPAVKHWPNLTYLGDLTEDTLLSADWIKIHNEHEYLAAHSVRRMISMKNYIKRMNSEKIYMDTPPTAQMLKDMMWPQLINCEYFIHRMRSPSFFFNNGKSNTDIHIDGCETLFFQVSGSRLWLMTPPDNSHYMYAGGKNFPFHGGISVINQHRVNLTAYPKLTKAILFAAVVNPGDLVYVPEAWFHNVMAKGNPNIATTIFFDSSNCEKTYSDLEVEEYVTTCDRFRKLILPESIECKKKLPRGTTWKDVFTQYGRVNEKIKINDEYLTQRGYDRILSKKWLLTKELWDKTRLPRMVLDADMQPLIDSRPDKTLSIIQTRFRFFYPRLHDIAVLSEHLQQFKVGRADVFFMLVLPHAVSASGVEAARRWLDDALSRFGSYPVGSIDLVLLEAPPCVPASKTAQDCERDDAMSKERLAVWRMLEQRVKSGAIRHLGVKDVSTSELEKLVKSAEQRVSVVCLRFDPLYRQIRLRKAMRKTKAATMVHSVTGSGWVRDGVSDKNPVFDRTDILVDIFSETSSVYATLYEWAMRRGYFVIPERTDKAPVAEINFNAFFQFSFSAQPLMQKLNNLVSEV